MYNFKRSSAASNRSFTTVNSNPKFAQNTRLSMNTPLERPKTGTTFQRPETSTGVPLRSSKSSYYSGAAKKNRFDERPTTGAEPLGLYSRFNTTDNDETRSDRFNSHGSGNLGTQSTGFKGN
jgi:hypothetical protein